MKSLRWRIALWFTLSLLGVVSVFVAVTYTHLRHELRVEKWERSHPGNADWNLHGSYSEGEVDDIAGELWRLSLLYSVPVVFLTFGAGYILAKRSFAPVGEMNRQLLSIGPRSLDQRIELKQADSEFRDIEKSINALLERLDTSFRHLTEFSAQVAHELRTPLTLIRLQVEEAAGRIEPALSEALQDELSRLSDYVDQCLLLARAEQGRLTLQVKPLPVRALITGMLETYELLARVEGRGLTVLAPVEFEVEGDERSLRQILHNLLTNALRHGSGPITISLEEDGRAGICRIENALPARAASKNSGSGLGHRLVTALAAVQPALAFSTRTEAGRYVAELRWGTRRITFPQVGTEA